MTVMRLYSALCCSTRRTFRRTSFVLGSPQKMFSTVAESDTATKCGKVWVNGVNLYYCEQGPCGRINASNEKAILCMPGALGTIHTDFSPQFECFKQKASQYTIVGYDPRGYGQSRPPNRDFEVEPNLFFATDALDAYTLMVEKLHHERFSVLGWSDGGVSAILLAAMYPECVDKLVVWGASAYISNVDVELFEKTRNIADWSKRMRDPLENIYGSSLQSVWSKWVDSMIEVHKKRNGELCVKECSEVKCPTLIIHGAKDPMCPQFHAEYLKENISDSHLIVMPEGKHNLHLRYAKEFNAIVDNFLTK